MDHHYLSHRPISPIDQVRANRSSPWKQRPLVSVIIPTLNEANNLPLVLPYLPMDWVDEVILVDGRSTDGTVEIAQRLLPEIKVVLETTPGKGAAMLAGYRASIGDILIVLDADGSNDPREIPRYVKPLLEGADMVKGSRFAPGGGTTDMPRIRKWGNYGFVILSNLLFSATFTDLCYGYHAFWRHCLETLDLDGHNGFEIDTLLYLQALRKKFRIVEVPSFEGYRFYGVGKLKAIPDGLRVLRAIYAQWLAQFKREKQDLYIGFRGVVPSSQTLSMPLSKSKMMKQAVLEIQFLRLFGMMLFNGFPQEKALERVLEFSLNALDAGSGSLLLLDDKGNLEYACVAYGGEFQSERLAGASEVLEKGLAGWVIRNRQPALVNDTSDDPRWLRRDWDTGPRSALAIPVMTGNRVSAVMTLVQNDESFTEDDLLLLREFMVGV